MTRRNTAEETMQRKEGYITVLEAAKHALRSTQRIYGALDAEEIDGRYIGKARYVKYESLLKWLNRHDPNASKYLGLPNEVPSLDGPA